MLKCIETTKNIKIINKTVINHAFWMGGSKRGPKGVPNFNKIPGFSDSRVFGTFFTLFSTKDKS